MSRDSGSACSAFGSRSSESCSALKPRISVRLESWHERHSETDGMLWRLPLGDVGDVGDAALRGQLGVSLRVVPRIRRKHPAVLARSPQEARLDLAPVERKLLPESRADRQLPLLQVGDVDLRSGRQPHPAPLARAVAPERILRRERTIASVDLQRGRVGVETRLRQEARRHRRRRPRLGRCSCVTMAANIPTAMRERETS